MTQEVYVEVGWPRRRRDIPVERRTRRTRSLHDPPNAIIHCLWRKLCAQNTTPHSRGACAPEQVRFIGYLAAIRAHASRKSLYHIRVVRQRKRLWRDIK